jgi:hypothetical protein
MGCYKHCGTTPTSLLPRKEEEEDRRRLGDLKAHIRACFTLALLQTRKPLAHLLVRLVDKSVVGAAHGNDSLEALNENALLLASMSSSSRRLRRQEENPGL